MNADSTSPGELKVIISEDRLQAYIFAPEGSGPLTPEEVYQALHEAGVVYGIREEAVASFASAPASQPVLVAEGEPPQPGEDERLEVLFEAAPPPKEEREEKERVDFRETSSIVSVEAQALLAVKHPARPGVPGKAVTGEELFPPEPKVLELRAGRNVELRENGTQVVALVSGRPWYKRVRDTYTFHVDPLLVFRGDVCIKSGNVRFKGDVKIFGNVCEAMEVQATGKVEISGLVTRATVTSGGHLTVHGGVIASKIRAGITFAGAKKLAFLLRDIKTNLHRMVQALEQLKEQVEEREIARIGFARLVWTLMDNKFKNLRSLAKSTQQQIAAAGPDAPPEIFRVRQSLNCLLGLNPLTPKSLAELMREVEEAFNLLQEGAANPANVTVPFTLASTILSSGSVFVTRRGCVNTIINAYQGVVVKGSFKGGEIFCEEKAEIEELGSALGTPSVVRVGPAGTIRVGRVFPGVVLQVGESRYVVTQEGGPLKARLGKDGLLEIIPY